MNSAAHINARVTALQSAHVLVVLQACERGRQEQEEQPAQGVVLATPPVPRFTLGCVGPGQLEEGL